MQDLIMGSYEFSKLKQNLHSERLKLTTLPSTRYQFQGLSLHQVGILMRWSTGIFHQFSLSLNLKLMRIKLRKSTLISNCSILQVTMGNSNFGMSGHRRVSRAGIFQTRLKILPWLIRINSLLQISIWFLFLTFVKRTT